MSDTPIICGHCREPLTSLSGARHFGWFMTHAHGECAQILLAKVAAVTAERDALRAALADMLNGWKYIRGFHGDLYGVGWDRAQEKAELAMRIGEAKP